MASNLSGQLPYLVEYAKTGRSKCKGCKNPVEKNHLRIAKVVRSPFHDGVIPNWFHRDCFFARCRPTAVTEIENLDNISWEDQESLRKEIENPEAQTSAPGSSKKKRPAAASAGWSIGYALSNRSKCVACDTPIIKGHIRAAKLDTDSKNGVKFQGVWLWHHLDCFVKVREALGYFDAINTCSGFDKLSDDDQKEVSAKIPAIEHPEGPSPAKKAKPAGLDAEEQKKLEEQNMKLCKFREELSAVAGHWTYHDLLTHNNQQLFKTESEMLTSLVDQMYFGALKPCKKCSGKIVFISGVGYKCQGDLTEWTKCEHVTLDPERTEFKIPDYMLGTPFFKDYKSQVSKRILRISEPPVASPVKKTPEDAASLKVDRGPMPLRGLDFVIAGRMKRSKEELKQAIMELGGKVVGKVHENLAAVIADEKTLKRGSNVINEAQKHEIQVVTEDFVDEAKDYNDPPIALINKKNIASWGADPKTRIDISITKSCGSTSGFEKSGGKVKMVFADGCAVDPDSGLVDDTYVFSNSDGKFSTTLVKTDIQSKKNSYYKLQVLKSKFHNSFWIFKSWGRIGTTAGGHKVDKCPSEYKATSEFYLRFYEKTGNRWNDENGFVKMPGKMYPIDDQDDSSKQEQSLNDTTSTVTSTLKQPVQDLIKIIFDVEMMKKTLKEFELDTDKMPLGKLSRRQLEKAYGVLKEVQELLAQGDPERALLIDASNRFYTLVPHSFGLDEPTVLDNAEIIQAKCQMLDSLMEMEVAYSLLSARPDDVDRNPLDVCYGQLNAEIDVLDRDSKEFKMIEEYTRNTHAETHQCYELEIDNVFVVKRQGEYERFKPFKNLHNRRLLWHGSRTTNYAGILSQGLRIAPPEAPCTGYMFGKGVYFADMVSKSANYCCTSKSYPTGLLLLCEVALGDMYEKYSSEFIRKLPEGKHSTLGVGSTQPDPEKTLTTEDGVLVPLGPGVPSKPDKYCSLLYNEYIVYDVAQINVKYLIQMKFKYKY